jgi:hypothetical protein
MVSFSRDIRPLFREQDRLAMDYVFDLWSYEEVVENADVILQRLTDGSMPCDAGWPESQLNAFRQWIEDGCPA